MQDAKRGDESLQIFARLDRAEVEQIVAVDVILGFDARDLIGIINALDRWIETGIGHRDRVGIGVILVDEIALGCR